MGEAPAEQHRPEGFPLPIPKPRETFADDMSRAMIVAEAKLLVRQLDEYLELMGDWATEGDNSASE